MKNHRRIRTILMLTPAVLVLLIFYGGALLTVILQSFGYAPLYGINTFPTLSHYRTLVTSTGFWGSLGLTLTYALVPTVIGTLLSIHLALLLQRKGWGQRVFRYVYTLPLVVPYLVGVALITLLWANGGLLARIAFSLGWIESTRDFPRILYSRAGWGVMLVYAWKQLPFTTLLLSSLLAGSSPDYEAAAATLGANSWQRFWHVTLPKLVPGIVSATLIVFAFNAGSFEVPFILGGGFPGTLPVKAWRAFNDADPARRLTAMTIMTIVALLSSLILLVYLASYKRLQRAWGDA